MTLHSLGSTLIFTKLMKIYSLKYFDFISLRRFLLWIIFSLWASKKFYIYPWNIWLVPFILNILLSSKSMLVSTPLAYPSKLNKHYWYSFLELQNCWKRAWSSSKHDIPFLEETIVKTNLITLISIIAAIIFLYYHYMMFHGCYSFSLSFGFNSLTTWI